MYFRWLKVSNNKKIRSFILGYGGIFLAYLCIGIMIYGKGLKSPWVNGCALDYMLAFPFRIQWSDLIHLFTPSYRMVMSAPEYHPLLTFIHFLNARLGGDNPLGLKLLNFFFIIFSSAMVYASSLYLTRRPFWSFMAGLIYLSHPIHMDPIYSPDMNSDAVMTAFALLAFFGHCRGNFALVIGGYVAALFSKETAFFLPILLLLYDLFLPRNYGVKLREKVFYKEYIWLGGITFAYLIMRFFIINAKIDVIALPPHLTTMVFAAMRNLIAALKYLVLPARAIPSFSIINLILTGCLFTAIFKIASVNRGWRWPAFCLSWMGVSLIIYLGVIPVPQLSNYLYAHQVNGCWLGRHYLTLSAVAFCWLLSSCFSHLAQYRNKKLRLIVGLLALIFCLNNVRIIGCHIFAKKYQVDAGHALVITLGKVSYSFRDPLFSESILPSLSFFRKNDSELVEKVRKGLKPDFTHQQIEMIIDYFGETAFNRNVFKAQSYFTLRKIKEPQKFINVLMSFYAREKILKRENHQLVWGRYEKE